MDFGLARINNLLEALGNPHDRLRVFHVAGTNGKGSVCAYISSVLHHHSLAVGRFNSPHLLEPRDSIQVGGKPVSQELYLSGAKHIQKVDDEKSIKATSFELQVALALWIFDQHNVDVAVIEVGMGGLLDATNVFSKPLISIITPIGWDHANMLGGTLLSIAEAKAGIMKKGCPVVVGGQEDDVLKVLLERAKEVNAPFRVAKPAERKEEEGLTIQSNTETWHVNYNYTIPLNGDYQRTNSAIAVTALDWISHSKLIPGFILDKDLLKEGMKRTSWPGRLDWVTCISHPSLSELSGKLPQLLVDGAHNPPATVALREYVDDYCSRHGVSNVLWVLGATLGKDIDVMLKALLKPNDLIYAVPFSQPEGMPWISCVSSSVITEHAQSLGIDAEECSSLLEAIAKVSEKAYHKDSIVVLCGSLYLVADFYRLLSE
ncbi:Mur ligase [Spinellus fusiger]|nr:Mur ligase [Spinellus fusiger]